LTSSQTREGSDREKFVKEHFQVSVVWVGSSVVLKVLSKREYSKGDEAGLIGREFV
jgi:hypothetical protein